VITGPIQHAGLAPTEFRAAAGAPTFSTEHVTIDEGDMLELVLAGSPDALVPIGAYLVDAVLDVEGGAGLMRVELLGPAPRHLEVGRQDRAPHLIRIGCNVDAPITLRVAALLGGYGRRVHGVAVRYQLPAAAAKHKRAG
jgi:hypothetical protein